MKKLFTFTAITLIILTFCATSCKKSEYLEPTNRNNTQKTYYQPPKTDDLKAYLRDFKQKMQSRENDDTMDIEDAAWHLSSIANYDFGDVVSRFDKFQSDTLYYNINVENGMVKLSDLNSLYTRASADITTHLNSLNLENKHIRFIGTDISNDGSVIMSILVTSGWPYQTWYFPDPITLYETLSPYYDDDYYCDYDDFTDTLQTMLNLLVAYHPTSSGRVFFSVFKTVDFYYYNYPDVNANYYYDYRIFAFHRKPIDMCANDFFYYFDSYAGLAVDSSWSGLMRYDIIDFNIIKQETPSLSTVYHQPRVRYGVFIEQDTVVHHR